MSVSMNTTLFAVANAVLLCVLVSRAPAVDQRGVTAEVPSVEEIIPRCTDSEEPNNCALLADACDCGPHSSGCELQNGTKVCKCDYHYRQEGEICKAWCSNNYDCGNGAQCVKESCQCLPGTSGDFCKTVDECEGIKGPILCGDPQTALCWYDPKTQKPFCMCRILDYAYYPQNRTCIECDCGNLGSCTLVEGKKTCKCNEGAAVKTVEYTMETVVKCEGCDCGNNSDGCAFNGSETVCSCKNGTSQQFDLFNYACNECDCGPNGQCYFNIGWSRFCICDEGYKPFLNLNETDLFCKECDCGKNGVCSFKDEVKQCKCNPGYAVREGICTACQCYADGKTVDCTFTKKIQTCLCPDGYETSKFFCKDIDECLNTSNACPSTTNCVNTMGSYECTCKEGYAPRIVGGNPKIAGCEDINECEYEDLCPRNHTICQNYPGTYSCICKRGHVPVPPNKSPKVAGCVKEENEPTKGSSGWNAALIVLGVFFCVCILTTLTVIMRRRYAKRSDLGMDTEFQNIR